MPTYNTKCSNDKCENSKVVTEVRKKMSEEYPPCNECGSHLETVLQASGFVLRGRGWCGKSKR